MRCTHVPSLDALPPALDVCEACVPIGGTWVHLRQCLTCGTTRCCDSSPNQHMTAHWHETRHPVMRGISPGEGWVWCHLDDAMVRQTPDGWQTYDPFVETGVIVARRELDAGRSLDVGEDHVTPEGFPLGEWAAYVREAHGEHALDPVDEREISGLSGWRW